MPTLIYREHQIPYTLKPSRRRRTVALQVNGQQQVVVLAPHRLSLSSIDRFIHARADWLLEKLQYFEALGRQYPPKTYQNGETFLIRGEAHVLRVLVDLVYRRPQVEKIDGIIEVRAAHPEKIPQALLRWYKTEAAGVVDEAIHRLAPMLGVFPKQIRIANQKRRWGSCSTRGDLRFNWRIAMMPPTVADYVVVHELAHMRVPNHSAQFWSTVASVVPDYKIRRQWLRINGAQFSMN